MRWDNIEAWTIENRSFSGFASPYVGNGTLGTRLGVLMLGTDPQAPTWKGTANIPQRPYMPLGDPDKPLPTFSSFVYDGHQYALPAWNQLALTIDGIDFNPQNGKHEFRQRIDLRTGEASLIDTWEYAGGKRAAIEVILCIPRTHAHCSLWQLRINAPGSEIIAVFGLEAEHLAENLPMIYKRDNAGVTGSCKTAKRGRAVVQGIVWQSNGREKSCETGKGFARITVTGVANELNLSLFHSIHGGLDPAGAEERVREDLAALPRDLAGDLHERNLAIWKELWRNALRTDDLPAEDARLVLVNQFYLLASLSGDPYPMSTLGVSGNNWDGAQLWDADLWLARALLPLWPQFARRITDYRIRLLPVMREFAISQGLKGAFFPWLHDENGENRTPKEYMPEIHLNIWIAHAAWEIYQQQKDPEFLRSHVWPMIRDIADFFVSRCEKDSDKTWHLRKIMGPDEAVAEAQHTTCDDNVLMNAGVRWLMRTAISTSSLVKEQPSPLWKTIAENLTILPTRADNVIPEHASYVDQPIKQADTIIALYLNLLDVPEKVVRATVEFYGSERIMTYGPLMTNQIEAAILMQLGDKEEGLRRLFGQYREYVRGPFLVPFECRNNDTAVMLTGIGGLLQALIYGHYRWNIGSTTALPRIGDNW